MNNNKTHKVEKLTILMHKCKTKFNKATKIISHIPVVRIRIFIGTTVVRIASVTIITEKSNANTQYHGFNFYHLCCDQSPVFHALVYV